MKRRTENRGSLTDPSIYLSIRLSYGRKGQNRRRRIIHSLKKHILTGRVPILPFRLPHLSSYINRIEELVGCPISWIGVGVGRLDMATKGFSV